MYILIGIMVWLIINIVISGYLGMGCNECTEEAEEFYEGNKLSVLVLGSIGTILIWPIILLCLIIGNVIIIIDFIRLFNN